MPFSPLDLSPVLWLDASDTSTITAADGAWLDGTGLQLPGLSGNYASTPDSAALSITGDIDIKVKVAMDDWTTAAFDAVVAKWGSGSSRSYYLRVNDNGTLSFFWTPDGTFASFRQRTSTVATGFVDGSTHWVRVTFDADNGSSQHVVKFYTSDDGTTWTQLGSTVTTAGVESIYDGTDILTIGNALVALPMSGTVYRAIIQDAFDTADNITNVVFDADFAAEPAGTLSFTEDSTNAATVSLTTTYGRTSQWDDLSGNGYNVTQATAAKQPTSGTRTLNSLNVLDFDGSSDYLVADANIYSLSSATYLAVASFDTTASNNRVFDGRTASGRHMFGNVATQYRLYQGFSVDGGTVDTDPHIFRAFFGATDTLHVDSVSTLSGNAGTDIATSITIGADLTGNQPMNGAIAEMIVVDGTLTSDQIASAEQYLGIKWGIYNAPDQITDLTIANVYPTSIDLTWSAPANNGLTITEYVVEYSADGVAWSQIAPVTGTSATVSGLSTGVEYDFRVKARNAAGFGVVSPVIFATPFDVASLSSVLWLDASDTLTITESGGAVSQWDNKGSLGNFTQGTAASQPTTGVTTLNGKNVLDFAGDYLVSADAASAYNDLHNGTDYIVAAVIKFGTTADPNTIYDWFATASGTSLSGMFLRYDDRTASGYNDRLQHVVYRSVLGTFAVTNFSGDNVAGANAFGVVTLLADPDNATASDRSAMFLNSGAAISNNTQTNAVSTADAASALHVGALPGPFNSLTGSIAELVIVTGANATEANRQALHDYLGLKWGTFSAPDQVGAVTATTADQQVTLSWSAPADNNSTITDYEVQYSTDGVTWVTFTDGVSAATSATVTGLTNGIAYDFRVAARNTAGYGLYSTPVTATPEWTPLDLSPILWLDASDTSTITESGGAVSQWDDKSGNANHVTQGSAAAQPTTGTRTINGLNVLDFDGSDWLTAGDKLDVLTGGVTIMAVAEMDTTSGGDGIAGKFGVNVPGSYLLARSSVDDKLLALFYDSATREGRQSTTYTSTTATVFGLRLRRDNASGIQLWRDGTFVASGATVGTTSYNNAADFLVGTITTAASFLDGTIAELVVVQSDLSDADMTALDNYLNDKWAVY